MSEEAPPAEPPPPEGEGEAVQPDFKPPCIDLSEFPIKADFFEVTSFL